MFTINNLLIPSSDVILPDNTLLRLTKIFGINYTNRRISTERFHDLFNITLVVIGIKPAAIVRKIPKSIQSALRASFNLYVVDFKMPTQDNCKYTMTWIARCRPKQLLTIHTNVGSELGYLRPLDISANLHQYTRRIGLEIRFIGKKRKVYLLNQLVPNATQSQEVVEYFDKYIAILHTLALPSDYIIEKINIIS